MTQHGRYGTDDRDPYALPEGWDPVDEEVVDTALDQALARRQG